MEAIKNTSSFNKIALSTRGTTSALRESQEKEGVHPVWKVALAFMAILAISCGKKIEPQPACGFVQNSEGQRVSWKTSGYVKIYYDTSVPEEAKPAIQAAIKTWEESIGRRIFQMAGTINGGSSARQDGSSVIYWMKSWDPNKVNREQARTDIYWIGDQLTEADLSFNSLGFTIKTNPGNNEVDTESLVLHELGHALGLAHAHQSESVMATTLSFRTLRQTLQPEDVQSVTCEYGQTQQTASN